MNRESGYSGLARFLFITLIVFFFGGVVPVPALLIYWYNETPPITYGLRKVLTPVVAPGGNLRIKISSDVTKNCTATVFRSIVDSSGVQTAYTAESRPLETDYIVEITVPLGAAPGPAFYAARLEWQCNMVQAIWPRLIIQRQIGFDIAPADGQLPQMEKQGIYGAPIDTPEFARTAPQ